jgi:tripartite-type tricarboxylate transporter receptor subunit TctC
VLLGIASPNRSPGLRDVPTLAEQGFPGFEYPGAIALLGPANMAPRVVRRINDEMSRILRTPEVRQYFLKILPTFEVEPSTPEELGALLRAQYDYMGPIIRRLGIRID